MKSPVRFINLHRLIAVAAIIAAVFAAGYMLAGNGEKTRKQTVETAESPVEFWTCSMHPQIRQAEPGQCPICGMDLIPVKEDVQPLDTARRIRLTPEAARLAEIRTTPVERRFATARIRLDGKIQYNEISISHITAWVPGRIERLFVDYTGIAVNKGDHMVELYSPELITAQQELLLGLKMLKSGGGTIASRTRENVEAARKKLRLWGLTDLQIQQVERSGEPSERITIYAPRSGIVIDKNAFEGMYVNTGARIYTVADLSQLWAMLDAYESDLAWIRYGQEVTFRTAAYPSQTFTGTIAFIDPILDQKSRTVDVRVNVANPDGRLKPEMIVTAQVRSRVAAAGKVMDPDLAGRWICPMHPDVVKDTAGTCDICGMGLVTAESLGYTTVEQIAEPPLVIPDSAPLITGERAIVYIAVPEKQGVFEGREIVLGPRAGDFYIVEHGLAEGEQVVVNGNFKIDSAVQIQAKPSMMSPKEDTQGTQKRVHEHAAQAAEQPLFRAPEVFRRQLDGVVSAYYELQQALSRDDFPRASNSLDNLLGKLQKVDMSLLTGPAHMAWMKNRRQFEKEVASARGAENITAMRRLFEKISDSLFHILQQFGAGGTVAINRFRCPMASENRGAYWLQELVKTQNPYFGSSMYRCGSLVSTIAEIPGGNGRDGHSHGK